MSMLVISAILTLAWVAGIVGWLTRRASRPSELQAWARSYGLVLTPGNRPAVTYYARLVIVTRVVGAVAAVVIGSTFDAALGLHTSAAPGFWAWLIGGWTFGAWWAERELRWPPGTGVASLVPRRTADYLPGRLRAAPYVAFGLVVALATCAALVSQPGAAERRQRGYAAPPSGAYLLAVVATAGAVTALTTIAVWRTVSRRQPPLAPDLLAADDAIRTSAAHQLAGGGTAVVLCLASGLAGTLAWASTTPDRLSGPLVPVFFGLWLAAIVSWRYYTYRAWRVRRQAPSSGTVLVAT